MLQLFDACVGRPDESEFRDWSENMERSLDSCGESTLEYLERSAKIDRLQLWEA